MSASHDLNHPEGIPQLTPDPSPLTPVFEWQTPTYAQACEFGVRVCAWCMEWRDLTELEEIVLREARGEKEGTGKSQVKLTAAWEGNARERQCCYRCRDRLECAVAQGVRGT